MRQTDLCRPGILAEVFAQPLLSKGRSKTALLSLPGEDNQFLLRNLKRGGLLGRYLDRLGISLRRSKEEIRINLALHLKGAPVPEPALILIERGKGGAIGTVYIEESLDGLAFLENDLPWITKSQSIRLFAQAIRKFHDVGGRHPELQLKNLLIAFTPKPQAYVIDLDKARLGNPPTVRRRAKELMRLYRSLGKRNALHLIGREGIAIFVSEYCRSFDPQESRNLRKKLWQELLRAWRGVRLHALFYPDGMTSVKLPPRRFR